jgi:hypothetical protein
MSKMPNPMAVKVLSRMTALGDPQVVKSSHTGKYYVYLDGAVVWNGSGSYVPNVHSETIDEAILAAFDCYTGGKRVNVMKDGKERSYIYDSGHFTLYSINGVLV